MFGYMQNRRFEGGAPNAPPSVFKENTVKKRIQVIIDTDSKVTREDVIAATKKLQGMLVGLFDDMEVVIVAGDVDCDCEHCRAEKEKNAERGQGSSVPAEGARDWKSVKITDENDAARLASYLTILESDPRIIKGIQSLINEGMSLKSLLNRISRMALDDQIDGNAKFNRHMVELCAQYMYMEEQKK